MTFLRVTLSAVLLSALTAATPYSNCGFTGALLDIQFGDCKEWPCLIKRGEPMSVEVIFKAVNVLDSLSTTIYGLFDNIPIPLYIDDQMCSRLLPLGHCPVTVGEQMSYLASLTVPHHLPALSVTLEWSVTDGDGQIVLCAQVPAQFT